MAVQLPPNPVVSSTLIFTVHWPIIKYDQEQSQTIAFIFYGTKKKKISKNRDHTTSKVHIQARRKIDNKKKFTDSQIAAWIWYQEKDEHEQIWIYKVHIYWSESLHLSLFLNEIIAKLEWTEINSQERTERAESLCWFSIQIIQSSQEMSLCCMEFVKHLLVH